MQGLCEVVSFVSLSETELTDSRTLCTSPSADGDEYLCEGDFYSSTKGSLSAYKNNSCSSLSTLSDITCSSETTCSSEGLGDLDDCDVNLIEFESKEVVDMENAMCGHSFITDSATTRSRSNTENSSNLSNYNSDYQEVIALEGNERQKRRYNVIESKLTKRERINTFFEDFLDHNLNLVKIIQIEAKRVFKTSKKTSTGSNDLCCTENEFLDGILLEWLIECYCEAHHIKGEGKENIKSIVFERQVKVTEEPRLPPGKVIKKNKRVRSLHLSPNSRQNNSLYDINEQERSCSPWTLQIRNIYPPQLDDTSHIDWYFSGDIQFNY